MLIRSFSSLSLLPLDLAAEFGSRAKRLVQALAHRRSVHRLCYYDERMLKDIGLTRQDVSAALDMPLSQDPSRHLRRVAAGRGGYGQR